MNSFSDLLVHMEWADARIWTAALAVPALADDPATRERLHHFHSTQWAYLQVLMGRPLDIPDLSSFADLGSVAQWARGFYRQLPALRETLAGSRIDQHVDFPWAEHIAKVYGRAAAPATVGECILQLALHTAHHRGQVAMTVRAAGGAPPTVDYIAWIWTGRPSPDWNALD